MLIGVDIRSLQERFGGGVTEYTRHLLKNIFVIDQENEYVLFLNAMKSQPVDLTEWRDYSKVRVVAKSIPNKFLNTSFALLEKPWLDWMLGKIDVLFFPNINFAAFSRQVKTVLTIHDLSFKLMPEFYSLKSRLWHQAIRPKKMIKQVNKIIAVSQNTAWDLQKLFSVSPDKITVIHSGVNFQEISNLEVNLISLVKKKYSLPANYILMLGASDPRKNSMSLIEAYNRLSQRVADLPYLLLVGNTASSTEEIKVIKQSEVREKIVIHPYLPQDEKLAILHSAAVLVYPSYYEGFGFPPLEAMAAGVPVIASNNSSLPEVIGGAGILFNPHDARELTFALQQVLVDNRLREDLIKRGRERVKKFSWDQTAKKTIAVLTT